MKIDVRFDHSQVPAGAPTMVHVLLTLSAPQAQHSKPRPHLNIAAVIDRSGSMSGKPLEYAKQSVKILLDQLGPHDRFSLVAYDEEVLPLIEGSRTADRTQAKHTVDQIFSGGTTNLSGGWLKGIELVCRESHDDEVKAVLLLTDGQANQGVTETDKLVAIGRDVNDKHDIRTTCMGLGLDFNEDLLSAVAIAAGGRFHYIESPEHAPAVFAEELGGLLTVVAQNVEIELNVADGVKGIAQLTGHPWKVDGGKCTLLAGDFGAGQVKHVLLAVELPALADVTDMLIGSLQMRFAELGEERIQIKCVKQDLIVGVSAAKVPATGDPEVLLHIGIQKAAAARKQAVQDLDKGDIAAASLVLEQNRDALQAMAEASADPAMLKEEATELDRRAAALKEDQHRVDSRKMMVQEAMAMGQTLYSNLRSSRQRRG